MNRDQNDFPPDVVNHPAYRGLEAREKALRCQFDALLTEHRHAHALIDFYGVPRSVDAVRHGGVAGSDRGLSLRVAELATNTGAGAAKRLEAAEAKLRQLRADECVGFRIASVVTAIRGQYPDSHDMKHGAGDWTLLFMEQVGKLAKLIVDGPKDERTVMNPAGMEDADAAARYKIVLALAQLAWSHLRTLHMDYPDLFGDLTYAEVPTGAGAHAQEDSGHMNRLDAEQAGAS